MPLQRASQAEFSNPCRTEYVINLSQLDVFETGSTVDRDAADAKDFTKSPRCQSGAANGSVTKALNIKADSSARRQQIRLLLQAVNRGLRVLKLFEYFPYS